MTPLHDSGEACELVGAAGRDHVAFRVLARAPESPLEATLFHAQQAVEKYLKAALVLHGEVFRRTHDLLELNDLIVRAGFEVPVERSLLARLVPYAVELRYVGIGGPTVSLQEAEQAIAALAAWIGQMARDQS
jgi:HEPN domain-containing protein